MTMSEQSDLQMIDKLLKLAERYQHLLEGHYMPGTDLAAELEEGFKALEEARAYRETIS
jgi:cell fate (sporulation/competence/biofilm development) regulator YlbF (YheA/YmcA/DUF963 family)